MVAVMIKCTHLAKVFIRIYHIDKNKFHTHTYIHTPSEIYIYTYIFSRRKSNNVYVSMNILGARGKGMLPVPDPYRGGD